MLKKPIQIRPMTLDEYDEFMKKSVEIGKEAEAGKLTKNEVGSKILRYLFDKIYPKIDIKELTPATMSAVLDRTIAATNKVEEADIKNYETSGSGELKVDLNSVKLADKPQKSEKEN